MAVVYTASTITGVPKLMRVGNAKVALRDVAADTGTYVTGGNSITAASLGLKTIDLVVMGTQGMTGDVGRDRELGRRHLREQPAVGDAPAVRERRDRPPGGCTRAFVAGDGR
jgi:hypothetical protein